MNKKDTLKKISKNIQNIRKSKGYTQESFAEKMKVSWSYVSKLETGALNFSIGKLFELANHLEVDIKEILKL